MADIKIRAILQNLVTKELKNINSEMAKTGANVKGLSDAFKLFGTVLTGFAFLKTAQAIFTGVKNIADESNRLVETSRKFGISVGAFQELSYIVKITNTDIGLLRTSFKQMAMQAFEASNGNKNASAAFKTLGVEILTTEGSLKSQERLFFETVEALSEVEDATLKAALSQRIFGRNSDAILPMLYRGKDGIRALRKEAKELGIVLSGQVLQSGKDFSETYKKLTSVMSAEVAVGMSGWHDVGVDIMNGIISGIEASKGLISAAVSDIASGVSGDIDYNLAEFILGNPRSWVEVSKYFAKTFDNTFEMIGKAAGNYLVAGITGAIGIVVKVLGEYAIFVFKSFSAVFNEIEYRAFLTAEAIAKFFKLPIVELNRLQIDYAAAATKVQGDIVAAIQKNADAALKVSKGMFTTDYLTEYDTKQKALAAGTLAYIEALRGIKPVVKETTSEYDDLLAEYKKVMAAMKNPPEKEDPYLMDKMRIGTALNIMNRELKADKAFVESSEKKITTMDAQTESYSMLLDIAIQFAGTESALTEIRLGLMREEYKMYSDLETAQKHHLISYSEMMETKNMVAGIYQAKQNQATSDAIKTATDSGIEIFEGACDLMAQLSNNHLKEIDRWEERERERIDNSMLAEEYKAEEYEKIEKRAEKRRRDEFEEQKALQLALAVINTAAGVAQELSKGTVGIVTGLVIAAAGALEIATIASESYAQGGVVPGNSYTGDRVPIRVNSGEAILTREMQSDLFATLKNGGGGGQVTINSPITIQGNADERTVNMLRGAHEKHLEDVRSAIMELNYRGRLKLAA